MQKICSSKKKLLGTQGWFGDLLLQWLEKVIQTKIWSWKQIMKVVESSRCCSQAGVSLVALSARGTGHESLVVSLIAQANNIQSFRCKVPSSWATEKVAETLSAERMSVGHSGPARGQARRLCCQSHRPTWQTQTPNWGPGGRCPGTAGSEGPEPRLKTRETRPGFEVRTSNPALGRSIGHTVTSPVTRSPPLDWFPRNAMLTFAAKKEALGLDSR